MAFWFPFTSPLDLSQVPVFVFIQGYFCHQLRGHRFRKQLVLGSYYNGS